MELRRKYTSRPFDCRTTDHDSERHSGKVCGALNSALMIPQKKGGGENKRHRSVMPIPSQSISLKIRSTQRTR